MKQENTIIATKDKELQELIYQKVLSMRRMLFDLCTEDYPYMPKISFARKRGKKVVVMSETDWNRYSDEFSVCLGDLLTAREMVKKMEPVYREFHEAYEQKHNITFDEYMKQVIIDYDTEEFEQVRERFEEEYYKQLENEETER